MHVTSSPEPSVRIPVDVRRFPWVRRLAADYAYNFSAVAPFFSGDPAERGAWAAAIARAQGYQRQRPEVARVVNAQQKRRQAPLPAIEAGQRLADAATVAIVTGQQAGLFGGPLFTLLKALTALKLADQISDDYAVPTVAVFWIDAEDHDWEEVRACTVFDADLAPRTVGLPARNAADPVPVAAMRLDDSITASLDELERVLPVSEFRASLIGELRDIYAPGIGMAEAFGRWIERVLGPRGLVVFDSSDQAAKPFASQVFGRELSAPGQTARLAGLVGSDLTARGYHAQVHAQQDQLALFHLDGARRAIRQQDGLFVAGDQHFTAEALLKQAKEHPSSFSPNVLLRPIVQDTLFPTICYVAGPNELGYLGQLRGVYEHFGVPMPLMYPRATATILDSAALRFVTKYSLPLEALQAQDEAARNDLLKSQIPQVVEDSFTEAARAINDQMSRIVQAIPALDPTLEGAAKSTLGRMQHEIETLHAKMIQAAKRRDETLRRQFMHARARAFPQGQAQERAIAFVSCLNEYGPAFVERLSEELPLDMGRHWIVTI